jgi:hypothetical protein
VSVTHTQYGTTTSLQKLYVLLFEAFGGLLPRSKGGRPPPPLLSRCAPFPYGVGIACGNEAPVSLFRVLAWEGLSWWRVSGSNSKGGRCGSEKELWSRREVVEEVCGSAAALREKKLAMTKPRTIEISQRVFSCEALAL